MTTIQLKRRLEAPVLLEEYKDKAISLYEFTIEPKFVSSLSNVKKDHYLYINQDIIVTDDYKVFDKTGKQLGIINKEKKVPVHKFDFFPKPLTYSYRIKESYPASTDFFSVFEKESEIDRFIAISKGKILVWKLKWGIDELTFEREDDIVYKNLKDSEGKLDWDKQEDKPNVITMGKDIIFIQTYRKVLFYSLTKKLVIWKLEIEEGEIHDSFILPNGKIGLFGDSGFSILDIKVTNDLQRLEGSGEVINMGDEFDIGDTVYWMIGNPGYAWEKKERNDDFTLIYEASEQDVKVYTITRDNKAILKYNFSNKFKNDIGIRFVFGMNRDRLVFTQAAYDETETYLYDLTEDKVIANLDIEADVDPIRIDDKHIYAYTEGKIINENGEITELSDTSIQFTNIITVSKREKEVLKCFIKSSLDNYIVKELAAIVSKFIVHRV